MPAPASCAYEDEVASAEVVEAVRRILRFGFRIPAQDIEDVLQDSLVDFLLERQRRATATAGLFVVIARRRAAHYWRRQIRRSAESSADFERIAEAYVVNGELEADRLHETLALVRAWKEMTERCQSVLAHRFWDSGRLADIAVKMGCKAEALKKAVSRCLSRLRLAMERA